jgi:MFS family permease
LFVQRLPWLLFSLVSGVLVDRLDRRRLVAIVDLTRAVIIGALALVIALHGATVAGLYTALFLLGTGDTLATTGTVALLPAIVDDAQLHRANAQIQGAKVVGGDIAGPPLGAWLFVLAPALPFAFDSGTFVVAGLLGLSLRVRRQPQRPADAPPSTMRADIREGLVYLWGQPTLRMLAICICLMNITFDGTAAPFVLFARERLGLGAEGYGLLLGLSAIGSLIGAGLVGRLVGAYGPSRLLRAGLVIESATHLVLALTRSPYVAGVIMTAFGVHAAIWSVVTVTLRQRLVPDDLLGRVTSAYALFSVGGSSIGALCGGLLAHDFGIVAPFWFAFVVVALLTVAATRLFAPARLGVA